MDKSSSSSRGLGDFAAAASVLRIWREDGVSAAKKEMNSLLRDNPLLVDDLLQKELALRLEGSAGPRLLVDGVWFCRPPGGITRVWEQILYAWQLPGLITKDAPVCLIDRDSHLALTECFPRQEGQHIDPLDPNAVASLAAENALISSRWGAEVFLSSWISFCGQQIPACIELALVHDCLPERYQISGSLKLARHRWLKGASSHLAVSSATAEDLETLLKRSNGSIPWCHPAPSPLFASIVNDPMSNRHWEVLRVKAGLAPTYVLLPGTSAIGSYKNPELVVRALSSPGLEHLQLVLSGIGATQRGQELEALMPSLSGRILAAGFSDFELALVYQHALAVVIPSHIEGFGLPVVEALASNGVTLIADSRGLREAGGKAALRFSANEPQELVELLLLLLATENRKELNYVLQRRRQERLDELNPDLLGVCLLALARQLT